MMPPSQVTHAARTDADAPDRDAVISDVVVWLLRNIDL